MEYYRGMNVPSCFRMELFTNSVPLDIVSLGKAVENCLFSKTLAYLGISQKNTDSSEAKARLGGEADITRKECFS